MAIAKNKSVQCEELYAKGHSHRLLGEWDKSLDYFQQALGCDPDYAYAQLALAQLLMMQSSFREGRELYESRFKVQTDAGEMDWRNLPIPRWHGEPVTGKHLHLWVEQGFGDVIMFAGFLPKILEQKPARISISMFPKMMTLFARSFPQITIESLHDIGKHALSATILGTFPQLLRTAEQTHMNIDLEPMRRDYEQALKNGKADYSAPIGDLMVYGFPHFPSRHNSHHLVADPALVAETKKHLQKSGTGRRVGISWHTSNIDKTAVRSIPLEQWIPILKIPDCHFISLQHHVAPNEIENFCAKSGSNIFVDPQLDIVGDTEGLAAMVASMDEIITIDNSNAHLAGALGVPTTLLLPKGCDFRWPVQYNAPDTLWYRNVKTERQNEPMQWQPVIDRVAVALSQRTIGNAGN